MDKVSAELRQVAAELQQGVGNILDLLTRLRLPDDDQQAQMIAWMRWAYRLTALAERVAQQEREIEQLVEENLGLACAGDIPRTETAARKVAVTRMHAAERRAEQAEAALRAAQEARDTAQQRIAHLEQEIQKVANDLTAENEEAYARLNGAEARLAALRTALKPFAVVAQREAALVARKGYGDMPDYGFDSSATMPVAAWVALHQVLAAEPKGE